MLALSYVYQLLSSFRYLFARHATWGVFCLVILGMIGPHYSEGVSSWCRFWQMGEADYHRLLHFFHSAAWSLDPLVAHWSQLVLHQEVAVIVEGRTVMVGDHTYVVKAAPRMPGVVTLHQESQTQSKPSYFRGHQWGVIGGLVGSLSQAFCLPLDARLPHGFAHLRQDELPADPPPTLCLRLLDMALQFAQRQDCPLILVLDACFAVGPVFTRAASLWSLALTQPSVHLLTRAQKPYVASHEPAPPPIRPRGWPRQYGAPVKLTEVFSTYPSQFCTAILPIYGKVETVSDLALNLLWKPLKGPVRFVFAITKRGPIVLMTSDLGLDPLTALSLYCARVRIETMFAMLKGVVGAFLYHLSLLAEALAPPFSQTDQKYHSQKTVHSRSPPRPPYLASL